MRDLSFLWFKGNQQIAWATNAYRVATLQYRTQIQLQPLDQKPYQQITKSAENLPLSAENDIFLLTQCGQRLNINSNAQVENVTDINGITQIRLRLFYLPYDFGSNLCCVEIEGKTGVNPPKWFSNPFLLTFYEIEKTVRLDYLETKIPSLTNVYNAVRLQMYKNTYVSATEISNYYQITKGIEITTRIDDNRHMQWCLERFDSFHFIRLENALMKSPCYIDFVRNYPVEMPYEPREGDTNISENFITTAFDLDDEIIVINVIPSETVVDMLASTDVLASTDQLTSEITTYV